MFRFFLIKSMFEFFFIPKLINVHLSIYLSIIIIIIVMQVFNTRETNSLSLGSKWQVYWVFKPILTIDIICRVSILLWFPIPLDLFLKPLRAVPSAPTIISITVTLMFHKFWVLEQDTNICYSFRFLWFSLNGFPE